MKVLDSGNCSGLQETGWCKYLGKWIFFKTNPQISPNALRIIWPNLFNSYLFFVSSHFGGKRSSQLCFTLDWLQSVYRGINVAITFQGRYMADPQLLAGVPLSYRVVTWVLTIPINHYRIMVSPKLGSSYTLISATQTFHFWLSHPPAENVNFLPLLFHRGFPVLFQETHPF